MKSEKKKREKEQHYNNNTCSKFSREFSLNNNLRLEDFGLSLVVLFGNIW